jgi:hypothetical protein
MAVFIYEDEEFSSAEREKERDFERQILGMMLSMTEEEFYFAYCLQPFFLFRYHGQELFCICSSLFKEEVCKYCRGGKFNIIMYLPLSFMQTVYNDLLWDCYSLRFADM